VAASRVTSVRNQQNKQLRRFEPGVVIGAALNDHASHHKDLARSKRVFYYVQRLIEELVQALALGVEQLRNDEARARRVHFAARPGPRHAELPRDGGNRDAASSAPTMVYRFAIRFSVRPGGRPRLQDGVLRHLS
jgi:hypothetical protein